MADCRFCKTPFRSAQAVRAHLKGCSAYKARITPGEAPGDRAERAGAALLRAYEALEQLALTIRKPVRRLMNKLEVAKVRPAFDTRARQAFEDATDDLDDWRWFAKAVSEAKTALERLIRSRCHDATQIEDVYKNLVNARAEWATDPPGDALEERAEWGAQLLGSAVGELRMVMVHVFCSIDPPSARLPTRGRGLKLMHKAHAMPKTSRPGWRRRSAPGPESTSEPLRAPWPRGQTLDPLVGPPACRR